MSDQPEIRIGTREREQAIADLGEHLSAGRIDVDEFDERSTAVAAARTRGDLDGLFLDLPTLTPGSGRTDGGRSIDLPRDESVWNWRSAVMGLTPFLAVVLFFVTDSWLWFLAIPAAGALLYGGDGRHRHGSRHHHRDELED